MATYAYIDNSIVTELCEFDSDPGSPWVVAPSGSPAGVGVKYDSSTQTFSPADNTAQENKDAAYALLQESDWTQLPDIGLTLTNVGEWRTYRAGLRAIVKNPSAGDVTFPDKPDEVYS